ncbi:fumarylacetoacetate hydrolase family protein [Nonomuraea sp. M3C6]|uniref:Fumarylacetoacetate hydrolase family protein n=1 Tax=Nonomuraea marmarensis TaxID=3351344 RepID=A0ABW7ALC1_9ACTN
MKLATIRIGGQTRAVRIDADAAIELGAADLVEVLRRPDWRSAAAVADGPAHPLDGLDYAPLVTAPEKIVCVGQNYRNHILEMGRELPDHPTLFAKYSRSLIGANDEVVLPAVSEAMDWEAELALVIGTEVRNADEDEARAAIAGYAVLNDVTARDWQYRTLQWLQGKTFEATTPLGPWLVTPDEVPGTSGEMRCEVDGEVMQSTDLADILFTPVELVSYISKIITLAPGDVIATGTPGGVGHARKPPRYLADGTVLTTSIDGLGECRNVCRLEKA